MRFKIDENLPGEITELLGEHGHDALGVIDQQMSGYPDSSVVDVCRIEQRTLVTLDLDFTDIRAYPPELYWGIIVLRPSVQNRSTFIRLMRLAIPLFDTEPLPGSLWIVDDRHVRFRGVDRSESP